MAKKTLRNKRYCSVVVLSVLLATGTSAANDIATRSPTQVPSITLGTIVKIEKNSQGLTTRETDVDGRVMTYLYDHDGNMRARILPDGTKVISTN